MFFSTVCVLLLSIILAALVSKFQQSHCETLSKHLLLYQLEWDDDLSDDDLSDAHEDKRQPNAELRNLALKSRAGLDAIAR